MSTNDQNQPAYDSLERPFRGGARHKDARGGRGLESVGRKASRCNRWYGRASRQDQKGERARH
jgi:hypothetical protein